MKELLLLLLFFSLAQIAHLEKLRTDKLNFSAAVFQKHWRRIITHRRYVEMKSAAVVLEAGTSSV